MEKNCLREKLYLKLEMQAVYVDDGSGKLFRKHAEKSKDFVWKHLKECFGMTCHHVKRLWLSMKRTG